MGDQRVWKGKRVISPLFAPTAGDAIDLLTRTPPSRIKLCADRPAEACSSTVSATSELPLRTISGALKVTVAIFVTYGFHYLAGQRRYGMKCARYQRVFARRSLPRGQTYLVAHNQMRVGLAYDFEQLSPMKLLRTSDGQLDRCW